DGEGVPIVSTGEDDENDANDELASSVRQAYEGTPRVGDTPPKGLFERLDAVDRETGYPGRRGRWRRPAALLAAACALVAIGVGLGRSTLPRPRLAHPLPARFEVGFLLAAPDVHQVSLVGEFNDWNPTATPLVRVGPDGPWVATVALSPGRHVYHFVID